MNFHRPLALTGILALAASAAAQSVNVDFYDGAGTPGPSFAGAVPANVGVWNDFGMPAGGAWPLVTLNGTLTEATLTRGGTAYSVYTNQPVSGDAAALLNDYLYGGDPTLELLFDDLTQGLYEITTYAYFRDDYGIPTFVRIDDDPETEASIVGVWPGSFQEGFTHSRHQAIVGIDGRLAVSISNAGVPFTNGIQLELVDSCFADISGPGGPGQSDGNVDVLDFLLMLARWGTDGPIGDITGPDEFPDGIIDALDLLLLISMWGSPANC